MRTTILLLAAILGGCASGGPAAPARAPDAKPVAAGPGSSEEANLHVDLGRLDWPSLTLYLLLENETDAPVLVSEFDVKNLLPPKVLLLDIDGNEWRMDGRAIEGVWHCPSGSALEANITVPPHGETEVACPAPPTRWMHVVRGKAEGSPTVFYWKVDARLEPGLREAVEKTAPSVRLRGEGVLPFVDTRTAVPRPIPPADVPLIAR